MENDRRVETAEYDTGEGFVAWCSVCNKVLIEDVKETTAERIAKTHITRTHHLVYIASDSVAPFEP